MYRATNEAQIKVIDSMMDLLWNKCAYKMFRAKWILYTDNKEKTLNLISIMPAKFYSFRANVYKFCCLLLFFATVKMKMFLSLITKAAVVSTFTQFLIVSCVVLQAINHFSPTNCIIAEQNCLVIIFDVHIFFHSIVDSIQFDVFSASLNATECAVCRWPNMVTSFVYALCKHFIIFIGWCLAYSFSR